MRLWNRGRRGFRSAAALLPARVSACAWVVWVAGSGGAQGDVRSLARVPGEIRNSDAGETSVPQGAPASQEKGTGVDIRLSLVEGAMLEGRLLDITSSRGVRVRTHEGDRSIPLGDLLRIMPIESSNGLKGAGANPVEAVPTLYFADGGRLNAKISDAPPESTAAFRVETGWGHTPDIRFSSLAGLRLARQEHREAEKELQTRMAERRTGRDTAILIQDGKVLVVQGSLERLTSATWEFSIGGRTRKGEASAVYGFVFGASAAARRPWAATVSLAGGEHFGVEIDRADSESVAFSSSDCGSLSIPWSLIRRLEFRSERVVFLSDLTPTAEEQRSLPGARWPARRDASVTGGPLRLGGREHARGLGVHAFSRLTYSLDGAYEKFTAAVGVDDSMGATGSVVFRVKADDRVLYESGILRGGQAPENVSVEVRNVKSMTLECDVADELDLADHADWGSAALIRAKDAT